MKNTWDTFKYLETIFGKNNFFLVGGSVRDELLTIPYNDLDFATKIPPTKVVEILKENDIFINTSYIKYGGFEIKIDGIKATITSMRKEEGYLDYRHPTIITFIDDMEEDVKRRDFTINGLYMDSDRKVYDYVGGLKDLEERRLVMIGDPNIRLQEDSLRILRAIRFKEKYALSFDTKLEGALIANWKLLDNLNKDKVKQELDKMSASALALYKKLESDYRSHD